MAKRLKTQKISAEKAVGVSFLVDISDIIINLVVAVLSGSVVMLSQVFQGVADFLSSGFLFVGVKRSKLPRDKKHPYGHGRELYFWTFLATLLTFTITAVFSFYFGWKRFFNPEEVSHFVLAYSVLVLSIFTNGYAMSLSFRRLLGKNKINKLWDIFLHGTLIETKATFVLDSTGVLASIFGIIALILYQITGDARYDGLGAMVIAVILGLLDVYLIKRSKDLLVGQSTSVEIEAEIIKAAKSFKKVKDVIDLRTLQIGPNRIMVNLELHLSDEMVTDDIEVLIDKIEAKIKEEVPCASSIQIELETPDVKHI